VVVGADLLADAAQIVGARTAIANISATSAEIIKKGWQKHQPFFI
jgi:hypothetical protein